MTVPEEHQEGLDAPYGVLTTPGRRRLSPEHHGELPGRGRPGQDLAEYDPAEDQEPHGLTPGQPADPRPGQPLPHPGDPGRRRDHPDDDYRFARHVGRKYGGADFRYADRPGESRVGVVLHPVRVNVTDLRTPAGS